MLSGGLLMLAGALGLGTYIKFIPYPVTVGFTAGIATIIFASQIVPLLGLTLDGRGAGAAGGEAGRDPGGAADPQPGDARAVARGRRGAGRAQAPAAALAADADRRGAGSGGGGAPPAAGHDDRERLRGHSRGLSAAGAAAGGPRPT